MLLPKSKRKRPNLETAHEWLKEGFFFTSPKEHFLSEEEVETEIRCISDELAVELPKRFPNTQNLEYAVLKGHILIEHAISQFIRSRSRVSIVIESIRFTFSQKLEVSYLMGLGVNDPAFLPCIELINKARNQVAHTFLLDRKIIDEMVKICRPYVATLPIKGDRQRVSALRRICIWVFIYTAAWIESEYYFYKSIGEQTGE